MPPKGVTMAGSLGRTDRMGPAESLSVDWKMARKRVCPPSTTASKTTSARSRPAWGREAREFSILTVTAGRTALATPEASLTCKPVRGKNWGTVVAVFFPLLRLALLLLEQAVATRARI